MNGPYELTIIISNYNQEQHLSETIESALLQKVKFLYRIIITDDHSREDRSCEIIKEYVKRYTHIEPILAEENKGYLSNILRAKEKTKTKYFCLLDTDDYWNDSHFLQRAYDFLESHDEYTIYEANVEVITEDGMNKHPFVSPKQKSGTYSKEMFLKNQSIPITQTTGMVFRNCIFSKGIPAIMKEAVGTSSERSFEGDTGRFFMHLKEGRAYYDSNIVGVYRLTENGIWSRLKSSRKSIIEARMFYDFYRYYNSNVDFFVTKSYKYLMKYLKEKQKELNGLTEKEELIDEYEELMANDVYSFCKKYEKEIIIDRVSIKEKIKQIIKILIS